MSKKTIILIVFLVILGVGGYFIYSKFLIEEAPVISITKPLETKFETEIFTESKFLNLKETTELPVRAERQGKINPFMQF